MSTGRFGGSAKESSGRVRRRGARLLALAAVALVLAAPVVGLAAPASAYAPHAPISVSGNAALASRAAAEGWPGDGSAANPIVISGYSFAAAAACAAIRIERVTLHFVIRDNHFDNCFVLLRYGANGVVERNTFVNWDGWNAISVTYQPNARVRDNDITIRAGDTGIESWSSGHVVERNVVRGGRIGIVAWAADGAYRENALSGQSLLGVFEYGGNADVTDNVVSASGSWGIYALGEGALVARNRVDGAGAAGIRVANVGSTRDVRVEANHVTGSPVGILSQDVPGVLVAGNRVEGATSGIRVENADVGTTVRANVVADGAPGAQGIVLVGGRGHAVLGNEVNGNRDGIALSGARNSTVAGNLVTGNALGILLEKSNGNLVYDNVFANARNARLAGSRDNAWNVDKRPGPNVIGGPYVGGNAWSDASSVDVDGDGLGEVPHGPLPYVALDEAPEVEEALAERLAYGVFDARPLMTVPVSLPPPPAPLPTPA